MARPGVPEGDFQGDAMQLEGFDGCVGFVDGTTFPLFQRPGMDGEVFFDCKKQYSINTQIVVDCNKYITSFMTGWPGLCADRLSRRWLCQ
jgi:hypothetical protein